MSGECHKCQNLGCICDLIAEDERRGIPAPTCSAVNAELVLQWIDDLRGAFDGWAYDGGAGSSGYDMALTHLEGKLREHQQQNQSDSNA